MSDLLDLDGPNPWRTQSSRVIFDDGVLRLRQDEVVQPDGEPGAYAYLELRWPVVAVVPIDNEGNVIIADTENHLIRKLRVAEGKIVRVAGTGTKGTAGLGGPPQEAELNQPHGVYVHPTTGVLYIADSSNNRVLKIERD